MWAALRGNKLASSILKSIHVKNVARWFSFIEATTPWIASATSELNSTARQKRVAASAAEGSYDVGLQPVVGGRITRFPPEPSSYLHIGDVKATLLNDYFAHGDFQGTLICRFDDTNPSKEKQEFEDVITQDLAFLGIYPDKITHSSDYFHLMYGLALRILGSGKAYTDCTNQETMNEERKQGFASAWQDASVADNLLHFKEMESRSGVGAKWCIRAKISIDNTNKALRDPVIYRCNTQPHHQTGNT